MASNAGNYSNIELNETTSFLSFNRKESFVFSRVLPINELFI